MAYAIGVHSRAICDRCGFEVPYLELREEWTGFKVCDECFDTKHPQLEPITHASDPQALYQPRPDAPDNNVTVELPAFNDKTAQKERLLPLVGVVSSVSVPTHVPPVVPIVLTVTVATGTNQYGTGNKFYVSGYSGASPTISLIEGKTYRLDQSDASNSGHPLRFSTTSNGTHGGGTEYTTGVTTNGTPGTSGAYTEITVASGAPTLYYYCQVHSGMGGQADTP